MTDIFGTKNDFFPDRRIVKLPCKTIDDVRLYLNAHALQITLSYTKQDPKYPGDPDPGFLTTLHFQEREYFKNHYDVVFKLKNTDDMHPKSRQGFVLHKINVILKRWERNMFGWSKTLRRPI